MVRTSTCWARVASKFCSVVGGGGGVTGSGTWHLGGWFLITWGLSNMAHGELPYMGEHHEFKLQRLGDVADVLINEVSPNRRGQNPLAIGSKSTELQTNNILCRGLPSPTWRTNLLLPYYLLVGCNGTKKVLRSSPAWRDAACNGP